MVWYVAAYWCLLGVIGVTGCICAEDVRRALRAEREILKLTARRGEQHG